MRLIAAAQIRHGQHLRPCGDRSSLWECFTVADSKILFWYNVKGSRTTHAISEAL